MSVGTSLETLDGIFLVGEPTPRVCAVFNSAPQCCVPRRFLIAISGTLLSGFRVVSLLVGVQVRIRPVMRSVLAAVLACLLVCPETALGYLPCSDVDEHDHTFTGEGCDDPPPPSLHIPPMPPQYPPLPSVPLPSIQPPPPPPPLPPSLCPPGFEVVMILPDSTALCERYPPSPPIPPPKPPHPPRHPPSPCPPPSVPSPPSHPPTHPSSAASAPATSGPLSPLMAAALSSDYNGSTIGIVIGGVAFASIVIIGGVAAVAVKVLGRGAPSGSSAVEAANKHAAYESAIALEVEGTPPTSEGI